MFMIVPIACDVTSPGKSSLHGHIHARQHLFKLVLKPIRIGCKTASADRWWAERSLQLTAKHRLATPVNWKQGEDVIIAGSVTDEEAKKTYPDGWEAPKPYIRIVPYPTSA